MNLRRRVAESWSTLVRVTSPSNLEALVDPKFPDSKPVLYIPHSDADAQIGAHPYVERQFPSVTIKVLPEPQSLRQPEVHVLRELRNSPGILKLASRNGRPLPYVVPGGRFNELYGWDSYFVVRGLLQEKDPTAIELAKCILIHHIYEITHYGMVLNANRSYYIGRSQPPFLTDMALRVFDVTGDLKLLEEGLTAAIAEYTNVWTAPPRLDSSGLSCYRPVGSGIPLEVEHGHFELQFKQQAEHFMLSYDKYIQLYNAGKLSDPVTDEYLRHDRAMRESGHDTTSRFYNCCADLATIDLNALLYKYECDIATMLEMVPIENELPAVWRERARRRKDTVNKYMWSEDGIFYDYNTVNKMHHRFPSATIFWALWSGLASKDQASSIVESILPLFEMAGGLSSTSPVSLNSEKRQWDYPYGWAPHQILAWEGLERYGYHRDALRLATKWMKMLNSSYRKTGQLFEKYNVFNLEDAHVAKVEYGNQGGESGFGWTNASYAIAYDLYGTNFRVVE